MSHMLAFLNEKRTRRTGMYVGTASLSKFADFLRGYEHAVYRLKPDEADPFLGEFRDWIYHRFQTNENIKWETVILRHSADEEDAVNRFWKLLDEFVQKRGGQEASSTTAPSHSSQGAATTSKGSLSAQ
jgi:hypothetical protein